jgi:proline dehydrogenase
MREALLWASQNTTLRTHLPRYRFVRGTVARFMPGEAVDDAIEAAQRLARDGIPSTFTYLGENVEDMAEADAVVDHYLRLLDRIAELGLDSEISVKPTHLGLDLDRERTSSNLRILADRARAFDNWLWIDMESTNYVQGTVDLYAELAETAPNTGVCLQAYLRRTWDDVQRLVPLGASIRLVKGAYREPEELAFQDRRLIDESYLRLALGILERGGGNRLALATHDTELVDRIERAAGAEIGRDGFEVQMLYGIRVSEQYRLSREGYRVRTLIAYGPYWYPWFMRRLAERPANVWFAARNLLARSPSADAPPARYQPPFA